MVGRSGTDEWGYVGERSRKRGPGDRDRRGYGTRRRHRAGVDGANIVADVDSRAGQETARELEERGGRARFVWADVTSGDDVRCMVAFSEHASGRLRILVNSAGGGGHVALHFPDADPEQWQATLNLNLRGAMLATQFVLRLMRLGGLYRRQRRLDGRSGLRSLRLSRVRGGESGPDPLHVLLGRPARAYGRASTASRPSGSFLPSAHARSTSG